MTVEFDSKNNKYVNLLNDTYKKKSQVIFDGFVEQRYSAFLWHQITLNIKFKLYAVPKFIT